MKFLLQNKLIRKKYHGNKNHLSLVMSLEKQQKTINTIFY